MKKTFVFALAAAAIVASNVPGLKIAAEQSNQWDASPEPVTVAVTKGDIRKFVTGTGAIRPTKSVLVGSQLSGQIAEIRASFNDKVKAGDILAVLDDESFLSRVTQARADLAAARAMDRNAQGALLKAKALARHAEAALRRQKSLAKSNAGKLSSLEDAQRDLDVARSEIIMSEAQAANSVALVEHREALLRQAEIDLERTHIRAPNDGIVLSRMVEVGQTVAASLQAPELFRIADSLDTIQIDAQISEAEIGDVKAGNAVSFAVDAYPDMNFEGRVLEVRLAPSTEQNIVTYTVVIDAENPSGKLYPGMTASVKIEVDKRLAALRLPMEAVATPVARRAAEEGHSDGNAIVMVEKNGVARPRQVQLGLSDGRFSEIVSGDVSEKDVIVISAHRPERH